ncbi:MAG: flagellar hook-associated protein 3 [Chlamydiales bacterium]|nr:flagellar hook-associated protein FlgL [Chlamydiales bacterium]NCF71016.1 flagellar hook-associated protein 3 [Chlamydiales bacterium]
MGIGRIGNNQLTQKILSQLNSQLKQQQRLFEQISSNKKITKVSDDPVAANRIMSLRETLERNSQYESVASGADVWTNITNAALDDAISTWERVNEIAISGADGSKNAVDRVGMAEELEQLLQHLIQIGNTTLGGKSIFSGAQTDVSAFRFETDANTGRVTGVFFQGDSHTRTVKTKDSGHIEFSIAGSNAGNIDSKGTFIDSNSDINAFSTMMDLRDKLLNNNISGITGNGGLLEDISQVSQSFNSAQVRLGGAQEIIDLDKNRLLNENAELEQYLSKEEDADVAQLIMELNNVQNVYEAALASGGRIMQLTLLRYI